jgi:glycosyltransferase involved in cell wall biosynthesis
MPHGVDHAKFAMALDPGTEIPADMVGLPKPIIGFYGNIYPWIDFGLVERLAAARPAWTFVMIGQVYCDVSRLQVLPNVRLLGRREHSQLPGYCKAFDAAIIPYDLKHPRMESVNPVKTKELLAAGVPVVAEDIPELSAYGRDVLTCSGVDEWLSALEAQIVRTDRKDISQRMKQEDWAGKVAEMRGRMWTVGCGL